MYYKAQFYCSFFDYFQLKYVYKEINAGYPHHFFSPHSFRSGVVCQMLLNSLNGDHNRFNHVFNDARNLGEWVEKSAVFRKYIKRQQ